MIPLYVDNSGIAHVWNSEGRQSAQNTQVKPQSKYQFHATKNPALHKHGTHKEFLKKNAQPLAFQSDSVTIEINKGTDWYTLRVQFRICGALIGSIPSFPRQNDFLGLPMALRSEEAALLVEKGICELYELPNLTMEPTDSEKRTIKELEDKVISEETEALKKRKIDQLSQKIDIIIAGKKQKLLSKGITDINLDKQTLLQEEINKLPNIAPGNLLTHLPTEHYMDTEKKKVDIDVLRPSIVDGEGAIKYKVFKNIWERQHHITCGSKFGCDYLVYPGDPVRFHATYMVRCVYNQSAILSPAEFVAFGRLSVAVNKLAVLAFINSSGQVDFQTLQWHDV